MTNRIKGNAAATGLEFIERIHAEYHRPERIGIDPLSWPRRYETRADREVAAFLAASFAYGAVAQIDRSLGDLFRRMGRSPARFAREFSPAPSGRSARALEGFYHRFNDARDLGLTLHVLGQMLRGWGSIEGFWAAAQSGGAGGSDRSSKVSSGTGADRRSAPQPKKSAETIDVRGERFIRAALALDLGPSPPMSGADRGGGRPDSFFYLWPAVGGASACKRFFMFLRWVVRPDDGVDLGLWETERPSALEYPVDTHIQRIATYLGATRRRTADARARREITDHFRALRPDDPVRYDFALCRMGILRDCPRKQEIARCDACGLNPICLRRRGMLDEA